MSRIAILGSGAWGTALALSLDRRGGHQITLWAHTPELARQIVDAKENTQFLPGFPIPSTVTVTADYAAINAADIVVSDNELAPEYVELLRGNGIEVFLA